MTDRQRVEELMRRPYQYTIVPEEEGGFSASVLELSGCFAEGETPEEAIRNLRSAARGWLAATVDRDQEVPRPERWDRR